MRLLILDDASEGLAAIESAIRGHEIEIHRADAVEPIERLYVFAGWTLEETARDLVSPAGRRVDLTSSEFDLLMAFLRQPGQALSRDALLGVLRGANGRILIVRSIRWSRDCARSWLAAPIGLR